MAKTFVSAPGYAFFMYSIVREWAQLALAGIYVGDLRADDIYELLGPLPYVPPGRANCQPNRWPLRVNFASAPDNKELEYRDFQDLYAACAGFHPTSDSAGNAFVVPGRNGYTVFRKFQRGFKPPLIPYYKYLGTIPLTYNLDVLTDWCPLAACNNTLATLKFLEHSLSMTLDVIPFGASAAAIYENYRRPSPGEPPSSLGGTFLLHWDKWKPGVINLPADVAAVLTLSAGTALAKSPRLAKAVFALESGAITISGARAGVAYWNQEYLKAATHAAQGVIQLGFLVKARQALYKHLEQEKGLVSTAANPHKVDIGHELKGFNPPKDPPPLVALKNVGEGAAEYQLDPFAGFSAAQVNEAQIQLRLGKRTADEIYSQLAKARKEFATEFQSVVQANVQLDDGVKLVKNEISDLAWRSFGVPRDNGGIMYSPRDPKSAIFDLFNKDPMLSSLKEKYFPSIRNQTVPATKVNHWEVTGKWLEKDGSITFVHTGQTQYMRGIMMDNIEAFLKKPLPLGSTARKAELLEIAKFYHAMSNIMPFERGSAAINNMFFDAVIRQRLSPWRFPGDWRVNVPDEVAMLLPAEEFQKWFVKMVQAGGS